MLERFTLRRDMVDCRGAVLAPAGTMLSVYAVRDAAARTTPASALPLAGTFVAADVRQTLAAPVYRHLFRGDLRDGVARALLACDLPEALWEELRAMRAADASRYWHSVATATVTVRMLLASVGEAAAIARTAAAALVHDIGMRHVPQSISRNVDMLNRDEVEEVAAHPLLGAYHLALLLGRHPALDVALSHHWHGRRGYPRLPWSPSWDAAVVAVASAFAALTQPRPFRSAPYDARGAADVLIAEAAADRVDSGAVRLLVHVLRNATGDVHALRLARERVGHAPAVNRHTVIGVHAS